jgi:tetratricopeptide (TPR) repeat protein
LIKAKDLTSKALESIPNSPYNSLTISRLHFNLGQIYTRLNKDNDAEEEFLYALELDPNNFEAQLSLANLAYQRQKTEDSLKYLNRILQQPAQSEVSFELEGAARILKSKIYFDQGNIVSATSTLGKSESSFTNYLLALLHELKRDYKTSLKHYKKVNLYKPSSQEIAFEYSSNNTDSLTWLKFQEECPGLISPNRRSESSWVEILQKNHPCLPEDVRSRINVLYAHFQQWLPYRIYYQRGVILGAG